MSDHAWFAVRCCCSPHKLFGFLRLRRGLGPHVVADTAGNTHVVSVKRIHECVRLGAEAVFAGPPDPIEEWAIYSDDRPREFWRSIPEFVEVKSGGEGEHDHNRHGTEGAAPQRRAGQ